jgi:hypothetical protein
LPSSINFTTLNYYDFLGGVFYSGEVISDSSVLLPSPSSPLSTRKDFAYSPPEKCFRGGSTFFINGTARQLIFSTEEEVGGSGESYAGRIFCFSCFKSNKLLIGVPFSLKLERKLEFLPLVDEVPGLVLTIEGERKASLALRAKPRDRFREALLFDGEKHGDLRVENKG